MLIDTHCHLGFPEYDQDRDQVIERAKSQGIDYIIDIGTDLLSCRKALELSSRYAFVYPAIGVHPHDADKIDDKVYAEIKELAKKEKVAAIGETGLDYYKNYSLPEHQKTLFIRMVNLAKELGLPLVIHSRQAESDTLEILKEAGIKKAVIHCFSGDRDFLSACLGMGFFVSFTCNITYKKAQGLREIVKLTPFERMFLETDAPFLPPEGLRGKRNEPAYIKFLAQEIAGIKEISIEEVSLATSDNAKRFFNIK